LDLLFFKPVDEYGVSFEVLGTVVTVNEDSGAEIVGVGVIGDLQVFILVDNRGRDGITVFDVFIYFFVVF
jgi:hypothetical protein